MPFTIYDDQTGTGTGDFVARVDTIEEAREKGQELLARDLGYSIFDDSDEGAPAIQFAPRPTAKAREEGIDAYYFACESSIPWHMPCPYPPGSALRAAWVNGWEQAAERRRERERNILNELLG